MLPEFCCDIECRECNYKLVRAGKLYCNFGNRLGTAKGLEVSTPLEPSQEALEASGITPSVEDATSELEKLEGLAKKVSGEKEGLE